jgi:predicted DNA-binding transcriptional regulator AlpA
MRKPQGNGNSPRGPRGSGGRGLLIVPRLEELVADPEQVRVLDAHAAQVLKTQAITALTLLNSYDLEAVRLALEMRGQQRHDRLLTATQTAERLGVTLDWIYRHHPELPFRVRHGRSLRFSELGIEEYIRKRRS